MADQSNGPTSNGHKTEDLLDAIHKLIDLQTRQLVAQQGSNSNRTNGDSGPNQDGMPRVGTMSDFRRLNPPVFNGTEGPLEADEWARTMEAFFVASKIPNTDRVDIAKLHL